MKKCFVFADICLFILCLISLSGFTHLNEKDIGQVFMDALEEGAKETVLAISEDLDGDNDSILSDIGNFFEKNKEIVLVGLFLTAIVIGLTIYDRSKKRNYVRSSGHQDEKNRFRFEEDEEDSFNSGKNIIKHRDKEQWEQNHIYRSERLYLFGITGDYANQKIPITKEEIRIGRSHECNLVMRNYVKGISKQHCVIRYSNSLQAFVLMDLGSTYGTYLNGHKVDVRTKNPISPNDIIYLGSKRVGFRVIE